MEIDFVLFPKKKKTNLNDHLVKRKSKSFFFIPMRQSTEMAMALKQAFGLKHEYACGRNMRLAIGDDYYYRQFSIRTERDGFSILNSNCLCFWRRLVKMILTEFVGTKVSKLMELASCRNF